MATPKKCLNLVLEAKKRDVGEDDIRELIRTVNDTRDKLNAILIKTGDIPKELRAEIREKVERAGFFKLEVARRRLLNGKARLRVLPDLDSRIDAGVSENTALSSMAVNIESPKFGSQRNWDTMSGLKAREVETSFHTMLDEVEGTQKIFSSGVIDEDVIKVAYGEDIKNRHASQAYKAGQFHNELNRIELNNHGASIKKVEAFTVPHHWEMMDVVNTSQREFIDDVLEHNNWKKVEDIWGIDSNAMTPEEITKWRNDYVRIGRRHIVNGVGDWDMPGTLDAFNRNKLSPAEKLGRSRAFHFKSASSEIFMRKKYMGMGKGKTIYEAMIYKFQKDSRNITLLRELGPDYNETWQVLKSRAIQRAETKLERLDKAVGDTKDAVKKKAALKVFKKQEKIIRDLRSNSGSADRNLNELIGLNNIPEDVNLAYWGRVVRAWNDMSKLGRVLLSQFSDLAFGLAMSRKWGIGSHEFLSGAIGQLVEGQSSAVTRKFLNAVTIDVQTTTAGILARFSTGEGLSGWFGKARNKFFDLTGFQWWTNNTKTGTAMVLAGELANQQGKAFKNLNAGLRQRMGVYGVGEKEWSNIIQKLDVGAAGKRKFLVADSIKTLSDDQIRVYLKSKGKLISKNPLNAAEQIAEARLDLMTDFKSFFYNEVNIAIPTPGARERSLLKFGTQAGTPAGEFVRAFGQYKVFSTTIMTKHMKMLLTGGPGGKFDIRGAAWLTLNTSIFAYASLTAKDLLKGRTPRKITGEFDKDFKLFQDALLQGGGYGLLGDLLFSEYNRYGQGFLETLGGPTVGEVNRAVNIAFSTSRGSDTRGRAFRFVLDNTPFLNLFFFRTGMNQLFLNKVMEDIDPGYLDRVNKFLKEERGQVMMFQSKPQ